MKLNISKQKNESANVQNAQVKNNAIELQGSEYAVKDDSGKNVTFASVVPAAIAEPIEDAVVVEETQSAPNTPSGLPNVSFTTYKTKKGETAPMIYGFGGEDDPRWKSHKDAGHRYVSVGHRRDINGEKVYLLMFGVRYMDVAKALCGAYNTSDVNAWHRAEDACMAIYEQAQRDGKARWEAKKAEWAAARSEKLKVKSEKSRAAEDNDKQVAAMLEKLMTGGDVPENSLKHIDPKVLEVFTKKAA